MTLAMLDEALRAVTRAPSDAYWARRLLELVRDPGTASRLRHEIVAAVRVWASQDPTFFFHERQLSELLAVWAWPRAVLEDLDLLLVLDDPSASHFILGRLWLEARRPPKDLFDFYERAAAHLEAVEESLRVGAWHEAYCEALRVARLWDDTDARRDSEVRRREDAAAILDIAMPPTMRPRSRG